MSKREVSCKKTGKQIKIKLQRKRKDQSEKGIRNCDIHSLYFPVIFLKLNLEDM